MKCEICGKRVRFGHNVSHSKRHTKRRWLPNIRTISMTSNGKRRRITICTRCLRTQRKVSG